MIKHNYILNALDVLAIIFVGVITFYYKFGEFEIRNEFLIVMLSAVILLNIVFAKMRLYVATKYVLNLSYIYNLIRGWGIVILILFSIAFLSKTGHYISREWSIYWIIGSFILLLLNRFAYYYIISSKYISNRQHKSVLVIGSGSLIDRIIELHRSQGFHNIYYHPYPFTKTVNESSVKIINNEELVSIINSDDLDGVWISLPLDVVNYLSELQKMIRDVAVPVRYVPDITALRIINNSIADVEGMPVISLTESPIYGVNRASKWLEDKLLSLLIVVVLSPVLIITALAVMLSSPGPVIYRQERMGWNGRKFNMYKFRTMPVDVEKGGVTWGAKSKETTKLGLILRKTSIDELPQFFNVLKGDMSIVGPRPERPMFVDEFKEQIPGYMQKHLVKAGITGWAQINGWRGDTDLTKRIEYDLYYIDNWSLWLDFKIILRTVLQGFINKNAY